MIFLHISAGKDATHANVNFITEKAATNKKLLHLEGACELAVEILSACKSKPHGKTDSRGFEIDVVNYI